MQIQCPHCKSRYRLGDEMVDAYGGFVRCGNCNYKFNIHDLVTPYTGDSDLVNTGSRPPRDYSGKPRARSAATRVEPRLERDEEAEELNIRFRPDAEEEDEREPGDYEQPSHIEPRLDIDDELVEVDPLENFSFSDEDEGLEADEKALDRAFAELSEEQAGRLGEALDQEESTQDAEQAGRLGEALDQEESTQDLSAEQEAGEDVGDETTEESSEPSSASSSDQKVDGQVDEKSSDGPARDDEETEHFLFASLDDYEHEEESSSLTLISDDEEELDEPGFYRVFFTMLWRTGVFLFWLGTAVALAYLLVGQLRDSFYPAYKNHPLVQRLRTISCEYLPCIEARYETDLYEVVVSRMDEVGGFDRQLHVSIFLLNKAESAQVYPNILLTLKTIDGTTVGQRVIRPNEYFTSEDSLLSSGVDEAAGVQGLIKSNKLGKILIKLENPPVDAVGFEARVVK